MVRFCRKHPAWPDNVKRERVNGPIRWVGEPLGETTRKLVKTCAACRPVLGLLHVAVTAIERAWPRTRALDRLYAAILGIYIYRGFRIGRRRLDEVGAATERRWSLT